MFIKWQKQPFLFELETKTFGLNLDLIYGAVEWAKQWVKVPKRGLTFLSFLAQFIKPLLQNKEFRTNSLNKTFLWDAWFGRDAVFFNTDYQ